MLLGSGCSCGDDDGGSDRPDSAPDADGGEPDASTGLLRTGALSILEAEVTNPLGVLVSGALVAVTFDDETTRTVMPVPGFESAIGGCQIFVYDVAGGESPPDQADEGPVTITGTASGPFACGFSSVLGEYACQTADAEEAGGSANLADFNGTFGDVDQASFTVPGATFTDAMVGSQLVLSGFPNEAINGARLGILARISDTTLLVHAPGADAIESTGDIDSGYASYVGTAPIPGGFNFLDDGTDDVVVAKPGTDSVPALDVTMRAEGQGFVLAGTLPHQLPTDASPVTFACNRDADQCGAAGTGALHAMAISGVTTDVADLGLDPMAMPDPETSFAVFQCAALGADEVTIPAAAMEVILATNPTRIRTVVGRLVGAIDMSQPSAATTVLAGHAALGFTTIE